MSKFVAYFCPDKFYPVPAGSILRYLGHEFNIETQQYVVAMEMIGEPPKDYDHKVTFVMGHDGKYHELIGAKEPEKSDE